MSRTCQNRERDAQQEEREAIRAARDAAGSPEQGRRGDRTAGRKRQGCPKSREHECMHALHCIRRQVADIVLHCAEVSKHSAQVVDFICGTVDERLSVTVVCKLLKSVGGCGASINSLFPQQAEGML